jgi:hypothetical protein
MRFMLRPSGLPHERLARLSAGARRLLDYVAVLPGGARYAVLRHIARVTEEDMVVDLRETVDAGLIAVLPGRPNTYDFVDEDARAFVIEQIGPERLSKLRARAEAARQRVERPDS